MIDRRSLDRLMETLGDGGRDLVAELLDTFIAEAPGHLATLVHAIGTGDTATWRRTAHSLKSNAASLGALELSVTCRDVEAAAVAGDPETARHRLPELEELLGRTVAEFAVLREEFGS